jgi:hypothetical protein
VLFQLRFQIADLAGERKFLLRRLTSTREHSAEPFPGKELHRGSVLVCHTSLDTDDARAFRRGVSENLVCFGLKGVPLGVVRVTNGRFFPGVPQNCVGCALAIIVLCYCKVRRTITSNTASALRSYCTVFIDFQL